MPKTKKRKPRAVTKAAIQVQADALGEWPDRKPVPMALWGKDHFSTLAYLECRTVDHKGVPAKQHMRTDADRHPGLAFRIFEDEHGNETKYPTRLTCGVDLADHDDWDAMYDAEAVGLIEVGGTGLYPVVKLTEQGELVCAALRAHKGAGGNFADFRFGS